MRHPLSLALAVALASSSIAATRARRIDGGRAFGGRALRAGAPTHRLP